MLNKMFCIGMTSEMLHASIEYLITNQFINSINMNVTGMFPCCDLLREEIYISAVGDNIKTDARNNNNNNKHIYKYLPKAKIPS